MCSVRTRACLCPRRSPAIARPSEEAWLQGPSQHGRPCSHHRLTPLLLPTCRRQTLKCPQLPPPLDFHVLVQSPPFGTGKTCDSLRRWWEVPSISRLHEVMTSTLLADSICHLGLCALKKQATILRWPAGRGLRVASSQQPTRNWGPQPNSSQGTESCQEPRVLRSSWILPQLSLQMKQQPGCRLDYSSLEALKQRRRLNCTTIHARETVKSSVCAV